MALARSCRAPNFSISVVFSRAGASRFSVAVEALLLGGLSASVGAVAFRYGDGEASLLVLPMLVGWAHATRRATLFFAVLAYQLAVSSGIADAFQQFFPDAPPEAAYLVWLGYCAPSAVLFALLRPVGGTIQRGASAAAALIIAALPGFGVVFAGHPVFAAGELLPGTGAAGVIFTVLLAALLLGTDYQNQAAVRTTGAVVSAFLIVGFAVRFHAADPPTLEHVVALDMVQPSLRQGSFAEYQDLAKVTASIRDGAPAAHTTIILPEAVSSPATAARLQWWRNELGDFFGAGGVLVIGESSSGEGKSAARISAWSYSWSDARQSVPLVEWRPWQVANRYQGLGFHRSVLAGARGERLQIVQCYEALVPYLLVIDSLDHPDAVIAQTNVWWARSRDIPDSLHVHAALRARLLGASLITARGVAER